MRRALAGVILALLLLAAVPIMPSAAGEDDDGEGETGPTSITVYGYVSNISDEEGNVPLPGVEVTLYSSDLSEIGTVLTDSDGMFEFTYTEDQSAAYLYFSYQGYTVRTLPNAITATNIDELYAFSIASITPDEDGRYRLTEDGTSEHPVGMAITYGVILGTVTNDDVDDPYAVAGATVTLTSTTGETFRTETDSEGRYSISVPYGTYTIVVSCSGFQDSDAIQANTYDEIPSDIRLRANEFGIGFLGGLDMPHAMMVLGLIMIGVMLLAVMTAYRKSSSGGTDVTIVNDLEDLDDEDRVERP